MLEIDLRYRAKELEVFMHAQAVLELKLADMSARSLGEAEEKEVSDEDKAKHARWEAIGQKIKRQIREDLFYSLAPEHLRMIMDAHRTDDALKPLEGIPPAVARSILEDIDGGTFTHWANTAIWEQLAKGKAYARLQMSVEGKS